MEHGLQDGDTNIQRPFYSSVVNALLFHNPTPRGEGDTSNDISIINLGSGIAFEFERYLLSQLMVKKLECVDILPLKSNISDDLKIKYHCLDICQSDLHKIIATRFDAVCIFEVLEHIDKIDELLINAKKLLNSDGSVFLSFPNLSSILSRVSLLLGFQPHVLEASNMFPTAGMGQLGRMNYKGGPSIHHIRGLTFRAIKELVEFHGFEIVHKQGFSFMPFWPKNLFITVSQSIYMELKIKSY